MLKTYPNDRLTLEGVQVALRDLYDFENKTRESFIDQTNALPVLIGASFFELSSLAQYCLNFILDLPLDGPQAIQDHACQLDKLNPWADTVKSAYGEAHQYFPLLGQHHLLLEKAFLSYLSQVVAHQSFRTDSTLPTTESILALLPVSWIQKVIQMDCLCVKSEFERYQLTKRITHHRDHPSPLVLREVSSHLNQVNHGEASSHDSHLDMDAVETPSKMPMTRLSTEKDESEATPKVKSYLSSLFGGFLSQSVGKRKRSDSMSSDTSENLQVVQKTETTPPRINKETCHDDQKIISDIFNQSIIYTYMAFPELEAVKSDQIVSSHHVLESYWLQTEMANRGLKDDQSLPVFRFGAMFENVGKTLTGWMNDDKKEMKDRIMYSAPVHCAGVQYRVLLTLEMPEDEIIKESEEDARTEITCTPLPSPEKHIEKPTRPVLKALLQRSKRGPGALLGSISYDIYAFHKRKPTMKGSVWDSILAPVTTCDGRGQGMASGIPISSIEKKLWLIAAVRFQ